MCAPSVLVSVALILWERGAVLPECTVHESAIGQVMDLARVKLPSVVISRYQRLPLPTTPMSVSP